MDSAASIEKLAHDACFATQYQIKSKAEQKFYTLCLNITPDDLAHLMKNYSQNVLFVVMEYVEKIIPKLKDVRALFVVINNFAQSWFSKSKNASLIREDGGPLQYHVQNSVSRTIGKCLKYIYMQKQQQDWISEFIQSRLNHKYRLFLWRIFIQTVSIVDNELTFLIYRSLVYNFQQYIIPLIMDALLPYFQSVRQQIETNDLAINMHSHLSVSQNNNNMVNNPEINLFYPDQIKFTQLVFDVLKEVICFNYNITYSEYQSEEPIDNCLVCFPDPVTKKVANKEFVSSIFFVAEKLITDSFQKSFKNNGFLATTLQCIQKIMLTKLFYTSSQIKSEFIRTILVCMARLISSNKLDQSSILSLIQSNIKFLINVQLHLIVKSYQQEFQVWMMAIKAVIVKIITSSVIHIDNQLVTESIQLVVKIAEDSFSNSPHFKNQSKVFKYFGIQIIKIFIKQLFTQDESLIVTTKVRSYQDLKKNLVQFMKRVRQLCCLNLNETLKSFQPILVNILSGNNINYISNLYFFCSQFCDSTVLGKSIIYQQQEPQAGAELGKLLSGCLAWIHKYRGCKQNIQVIQVSILIFMEKLLSQILTYFQYDQAEIKITAPIFKFINENSPGLNPEEFLTFCYHEIAMNLTNNDFTRVSYTFEVLTTLLLKFKWGIKRQYFKQTSIAKFVLQLCKQLSQRYFDGNMLTLRKQLFKIITNISFDDTLDDYRTNINETIRSLEMSFAQNRWKVMYDLTGICEAIDTSAIYRYFMITLEKSKIPITTIMNEFFGHIDELSAGNNNTKIEIIKSILKLQISMIQNKGQRLGGAKNTFYNYKMIANLMPYWVLMFEQEQVHNEEWDEIIVQLYKIFNTLLKNGNTNFFMLERTIPSYAKYIKLLLFNMAKVVKWIQQYPTLFAEYKTVMNYISSQLMEVVFCNKDKQVVEFFNQLLNDFMDMTIKCIESLTQGNKANEESLQHLLEIVKNVFKYLKNAKKLEHKTVQVANLALLSAGIDKKYNYIFELFKFGISSGKKLPKILDLICKIINNMDFLAGSSMPVISRRLGLSEDSRKDLLNIWKQSQQSKGQFGCEIEEDGFLIGIKDWFKKCNNSTMSQPEY